MEEHSVIEGVKVFWRRYRRNRPSVVGLVVLTFFLAIALATPFIAPYPQLKINLRGTFVPPSVNHPFGTDELGKDIFSEVMWGSRASMMVAFFSVGLSIFIGILIGAAAGFYGGTVDGLLMRSTDMFLIIPRFLLAMVLVAFLGSSIWNIILAIAVTTWPSSARLLRAEFLSLKEREFVQAASVVGVGNGRMIFSEIMPNAIVPVIVNASIQMALAILVEAGLSFLGLGDPSLSSWGFTIYRAQPFLRRAWWIAFFPGVSIFLAALSFNLIGDGLNEALNPKIQQA